MQMEKLDPGGWLLTWDEFLRDVQNKALCNSDGFGVWATETESQVGCDPMVLPSLVRKGEQTPPPPGITHVLWLNR